jgi:hypothetical protein
MKNLMMIALLGGMVLLSGCSEEESASIQNIQSTRLPADLKLMQGHWNSEKCMAMIEGHTMRLTYEGQFDGACYKQNVCIKELDQPKGELIVLGDEHPIFYRIDRNGEGVYLHLRLYDDRQRQWISVRMMQNHNPIRVAAR